MTVTETAQMTPLAIVEEMYAAFSRGDIATIVGHMAPDVFFRQPAGIPWGGDYTGPEGVAAFFAKLNDVVETTGFEIEENIEAKDQVFTYGYYSSRMRATGRESRSRFVFRWQFRDGKVWRYEAVEDTAPIAAAAQA